MLVIEYSLGISANLYSTLPAADRGKTLFASLGTAAGNGPLLVTFTHCSGATADHRHRRSGECLTTGRRSLIALSGTALLATLAWLSEPAFAGHQEVAGSFAIGLAAAVAIICYALAIVMLSVGRMWSPASQRRSAVANAPAYPSACS